MRALAQKNKLLAHDTKPDWVCLLNLPALRACRHPGAGKLLRHFHRFENWRALLVREVTEEPVSARIQDSIVSRISDRKLTELRIAQAYVKLLSIPGGSFAMSVSLAWIGNCEIRIFEGSQSNTDGMPLFWLELFDHRTKTSVDTFSCSEIKDSAVVFEDFITQANDLNAGPDGAETQS